MGSRSNKLRSGYTTGACAAAAAKAATMLLLQSTDKQINPISFVEIPFPDGSRHGFVIHDAGSEPQTDTSYATVIKDAGDDPDVTNGAEITAMVRVMNLQDSSDSSLLVKGGNGIGTVTKPGLSVPVGEPAINPVPRKMIAEAVMEAIDQADPSAFSLQPSALEITISAPRGEELAKKTLNTRLGIIGGISILGTTGIVRPLSSEAWTASISASMDVARAMGYDEVVLSAGRTSERAHMKRFHLAEEAYVMMGDYLEFSLSDAKKHGFRKIHLCAQWAKMLKIAMSTPQTHVRHGAIDVRKAVDLLKNLSDEAFILWDKFNTAREIFDFINSSLSTRHSSLFIKVCTAAEKYAEGIAQIPVTVHLVSYEGEIIAGSE